MSMYRDKDESDDQFRARVLKAIGTRNCFAMDAVQGVTGACLDRFAVYSFGNRVEVPPERMVHDRNCKCPHIVAWRIKNLKQTIAEHEHALVHARAELAHWQSRIN